jgi:signal transduction histidine kinase
MALERVGQYLRADVESEPRFRQELLPSIQAGLLAVGATQVALAVFVAVTLWPSESFPALMAALGLVTAALARLSGWLAYGRWAGILSVWIGVALLSAGGGDGYITAGATMLVLAAAATIPLQPSRALLMGMGAHLLCAALSPAPVARHGYLFMLSAVATVIALVRYAHRSGRFFAHVQAMKEAEILSTAQLRAQLSENAVSVARLAAALTHEVNSPLGALKSAVDTLVSVSARCASADPEDREKLAAVEEDLRRSVQQSGDRLQAVVARLQRFAEVEQSDLQHAKLQDLIGDAALRLDDELRRRGNIEFQFRDAPEVICRPQQLTTVFTNLLSNACHAINGDGHIVVATAYRDHQVEVTIRDNGRGMTAEDLDHIFDPGFRVTGSRISTGNWSLFNTRQIIYEHGGDITIDSAPGMGTTVHVLLPA